MNAVDKYVKHCLLRQPGAHESRWSVLRELFFSPKAEGAHWNNRGQLVNVVTKADDGAELGMNYQDLDDKQKALLAHSQNWNLGRKAAPSDYLRTEMVKLGAAFALRAYREKHIDVYAANQLGEPGYVVIGKIQPERFSEMAIACIPYEKVSKLWVNALLEAIQIVQVAIMTEFGATRAKTVSKKAPKRWHLLFNQLADVKAHLESAKPAAQDSDAKGELEELVEAVLEPAA